MAIETAEMLVTGFAIYLAIGAVIAVITAAWGAARMDHAAKGAGFWFRLMIMPGVAGLWPFVLLRLFSGRRINAPIDGRDEP